MHLRPVPLALLSVLFLTSDSAHAQVLPPPRSVQMELYPPRLVLPPDMTGGVLPPHGKPMSGLPLAASPYPPPGYQPSAYQVWQNYGITYNGWLRPRVFQVGNGGYFLYNGAPYPYVNVMPGSHFPSLVPTGAPGR